MQISAICTHIINKKTMSVCQSSRQTNVSKLIFYYNLYSIRLGMNLLYQTLFVRLVHTHTYIHTHTHMHTHTHTHKTNIDLNDVIL